MMKIASDRTINGQFIQLIDHIFDSVDIVLGHSLMIVPPSMSEMGFMDVDKDDITDDEYFVRTQETQLRVITDRWE